MARDDRSTIDFGLRRELGVSGCGGYEGDGI